MMKQFLVNHVRIAAVSVCSLFILLLLAACSGVGTTTTSSNGTTTTSATIVGVVQSVDAANHKVTVSVSTGGQNQTVTISGLTDAQITALQGQINKTYKFVVTSTGSNSYNINSNNTSDVQSDDNGTQGINNEPTTTPENNGTNEPGSIDFYGKVQSASASSLVVAMPSGDTLSMNIAATTDRGDFGTGLPAAGQWVKVTATANTDGSFTASKLDMVKQDDQSNQVKLSKVSFAAVTTSAVGSDNVVHFKVGNKSYSYTLMGNAEVKDFANVQAIGANQPVKVEVQFNGSNGSITQIKNNNGNQ